MRQGKARRWKKDANELMKNCFFATYSSTFRIRCIACAGRGGNRLHGTNALPALHYTHMAIKTQLKSSSVFLRLTGSSLHLG
jgi:hypothetical protein